MKTRFWLLIVLFLSLFLASCQQGAEVKDIPTPEPGKANVVGKIQSTQSGISEGIIVRMAEIYRNEEGEGVYALDTASSPYTTTDENGHFLFENVEAMDYVIIVGDPMTKYQIITDTEGQARVWTVPADETTDVGVITIDF
jgi:hypothetical protein